jgi:DNA-binding PadR family transcriptional regulator
MLRPGSLYRAIGRLLEDGLVEELDERPDPGIDDERRRYYRLTELGRRVAAAEAARLELQVRHARAARLLEKRRG